MPEKSKRIKNIRKEYINGLDTIKDDLKRVNEILNYDWDEENGLINFTKEEFKEWFEARQEELFAGYVIQIISSTEQALKKIYLEIFNEQLDSNDNIIKTIIRRINEEMSISINQDEYKSILKLIKMRNILIHERFLISAINKKGDSSYIFVKNYLRIYKEAMKKYFKDIKKKCEQQV